MELHRCTSPLARWRGSCVIDDELGRPVWRECGIIDVSPQGMGLMLRHRDPEGLLGRTVEVQFPAGSTCLRAQLEGTVRRAVAERAGIARVTLESNALTLSERALATVLDVLTRTAEPAGRGALGRRYACSISMPRWSTERLDPGWVA